jgi:hypothetical protein
MSSAQLLGDNRWFGFVRMSVRSILKQTVEISGRRAADEELEFVRIYVMSQMTAYPNNGTPSKLLTD